MSVFKQLTNQDIIVNPLELNKSYHFSSSAHFESHGIEIYTGSISYINEATASIHPIVQKIEKRSEGKRGDVFYPAPYLAEGLPFYESAYNIDQRRVIDIYAEAQKHVDQSLSMTLFMDADHGKDLYEWKVGSKGEDSFTTRDINILRNYAWSKGIKSIYYVRTYRSDGEVSSVNECESCSI